MPNEIRIKLERVDVVEKVKAEPLLSSSELVRRAGVEVLRQGKTVRFGERAKLFHQGDPGDSLFFILAGTVRLYATEGTEGVELGQVSVGDLVGEGELVAATAGARCCSAIAQGQVDAVELSRAVLGPALPKLLPHLKALHEARMAKKKELSDFLNRW